MASTYLQRAETDPQGNRTTCTISMWVKRTTLGGEDTIFSHYYSSAYYFHIRFNTNNTMNIEEHTNSSQTILLTTNRVFRDTSGWYHFCFEIDTTQSTSTDRIKTWVNGVQETSFSSTTYPAEDANLIIDGGSGYTTYIGQRGGSSLYFNGLMSHYNYVNGTAYPASTFGETDSTTGEWKIKTSPSVTYGDKGFFILKDGNSVTDQSGEGNNFTVGGGTLTNTEDNPSDVFATMNPLVTDTDMTLINGNNTQQRTSGSWDYSVSTLGANTGKYYFEGKIGGTGHWILGATDDTDGIGELGNGSGDTGWRNSGGLKVSNSEVGYGGGITYTSSDVICVAMDKTNNKIYFRKNGDAWINSGDPTSGATGTGAFDLDNTTDTYFFGICSYITSGTGTWDINFGNGYFGTTAVSSAGTNASNIGIFEYDVPTGYTALSTKGLNQ